MASQGFGSTENHLYVIWDSWLDLLIQLIVSIGLGLHVRVQLYMMVLCTV